MSDDSVKVAQIILAGSAKAAGSSLVEAVDDIATNERWLTRLSARGVCFASFGGFARAPRPSGLEVNDCQAFRLLRFALLENKHYWPLAELIDVCAREPGRPLENLDNDEHYRFFTVPTSYNTIDRILLTLKRNHGSLLEEVRRKNLTPRQAAVRAGFVAPGTPQLRFGALDVEKARRLSKKAKADLLCEAFRALSLDAQCALLNRCVDPVLGLDLARQWRNRGGLADQE